MAAGWNRGLRAKRGFKWYYRKGLIHIEPGPPGFGTACWLWLGCMTSDGYGQIKETKSSGVVISHTAQHHFFELYRHPLRAGQEAAHRCHRRICVRPGHLYCASKAQNYWDRFMAPTDPATIEQIKVLHFERGLSTRRVAFLLGCPQLAVVQVIRSLPSQSTDFFDDRPGASTSPSLPDPIAADSSPRQGEEEAQWD